MIVSEYISSFHMPLFFIIAGYAHGMKERFSSGQSIFPYIRKSIIELYLPCMYFSLLYWLPKYILLSHSVFTAENFRTVSINDLLRIPLHGFNLYWFLCKLFFVKVLHMLFERYVKRDVLHSEFWLSMYLLAVVFFLKGDSYYHSVFYLGIYFHIGFIMKKYSFLPQKLSLGIILFLGGIAFFAASHFYGFGDMNIFTRTGSSLCTSLALFVIFYALNISNEFLMTCGIYSMVIYCLHDYVVAFCRIMFRFTGLSSYVNPLILFMICFLCTVFIPLIVVWIYKHVKCLHWIEYIFYPGRFKRDA